MIHMQKRPTIFLGVLLASTTIYLAQPGSCQSTSNSPPNSRQPGGTAKPTAAPEDQLIVELKDDADKEKFDDILQEMHGVCVGTINCGPKLRFMIIQAEAGKATLLQKKLQEDKDVVLIERNRIYKTQEEYISNSSGLNPGLFQNGKHGWFQKPKPYINKFRFYRPPHFYYPPPSNPGNPVNPPINPPAIPPPPTGLPDDPYYSREYDLPMMQVNDARNSGDAALDRTAHVYILDTGYAPNADSPTAVTQYDFSDPNYLLGVPEPPIDSGWHGTAVATVTAWTDNTNGFAGMANLEGQRCQLFVCRISQDGDTSDSARMIRAMSFLANTPGMPPGPVNLSFNGRPPNTLNNDPAIQLVAQVLQQAGFKLVLAAGNDGVPDNSSEQYARRVAACDQNGDIASFSETGPFTACAPGVNVPVYTSNTGTSAYLGSGTSFAAPRWTAAIAVLMAATGMTASQADAILLATGNRLPSGFIIPNLKAALDSATGH